MASQAWTGLLGDAKVATESFLGCALWKKAESVRGNPVSGCHSCRAPCFTLIQLTSSCLQEISSLHSQSPTVVWSRGPHQKSAAVSQAGWKELLLFEQRIPSELHQLCLQVFAGAGTFSSGSCWHGQPWGDVLRWSRLQEHWRAQPRLEAPEGSTACARWGILTWEPPGTMTSLSAAFLLQLLPPLITLSQHHLPAAGTLKGHKPQGRKQEKGWFQPPAEEITG